MKPINANAPVKCKRQISIHANSEKVWAILTDILRWPQWNADIGKTKINGILQTDTTFDWKTGGAKIHSTLHTVEPFEKLGWTGKALGVYAVHNWILEEKNGQTTVSVEESMSGFLVNLLKRMFQKNLEKAVQQWLEALKKECEI